MKVFIETERLIIRELLPEDAEGIFELDSNPKVHQFLGNQPIKTIEESSKSIQFIRAQYKRNGIGRWAIVLKSNNEFIGWAGFKFVDELAINGQQNFYDLGYRYIEKYWGQGYGLEAAKAIINYGFNTLNLTKISAFLDADNKGSKRILEKCGLRYISTFEFEGEPCDWMEIRKSEWLFPRSILLKNENTLIVREAIKVDAASIIKYVNKVGGESDFLTFGGGEFKMTIEKEESILDEYGVIENQIYLVATIDEEIAGILNISASTKPRLRHLGEFGISVRKKYWGQQIGSHLIEGMIDWAKTSGIIRKINLQVVTTNILGVKLYEKFNFKIEGTMTRAMFLDNEFRSVYYMGLAID